MKRVFVLLFICFGYHTFSQQVSKLLYKNELSFRVDNDNLLFNLHDGYYTNGMFLTFNKAAESKTKKKKIVQLELGQLIFNSETRRITDISQIDRPYAGYLFLRYGQTVFSTSHILSWNGEVGVVGPASGGEQVQWLFHKLIHAYNRYYGWQAELKTEPGVNAGISYMPLIQKKPSSYFKVVPVFQATLGTSFTNAKAGAYFCLGSFEDDANSVLWNAAITSNPSEKRKRKYELFAFLYPQLILQGYNATVQGGLFRKDKGAFTSGINHAMFQGNGGIVYSKNRFKFQADISFQTREATSQRKNAYWASLSGAYRFNTVHIR